MNDGPNATWLPNLVGGVSIWKLAVDLNEPKFFDGRLLVPETEGSESLPVTVRWDLTGLVPIHEARALHPADVEAAVQSFKEALDRVAKVFATPNSGYDNYKGAFTVPAVEAEDGSNYFYSLSSKKLYVINWGASPRSMAGRAEYVFGYEDWGKAFKDTDQGAALGAAGSVSALASAGAAGAGVAAAVDAKKDDAKKDDAKKDDAKAKAEDGKKRPWWMWPLFALIAIVLLLLALFLLKACDEQAVVGGDDGGDAAAEASMDGASDSAAAGDEAGDTADAGDDAAGSGDAGGGASASDAGDAGAGAASDAGDAGADSGTASNDDDDDDDDGPGGGAGGGSSGGSGKIVVTIGGAGGGGGPAAKTGPHRRHYQAEAVKWRIASGNDKVSRTEASGKRFDVWLGPGRTFQGVGVEWQDKGGKWHAH